MTLAQLQLVEVEIPKLHELYCRVTGMEVTLTQQRRFAWEAWHTHRPGNPFTEDDLRLVITHLKAKGTKRRASLLFSRLIERPEFFEEDLGEARQAMRRPAPTARTKVLASTGRPESPDTPAKTAAEVMAEHATMAKLLAEFKATL